MLRSVLKFLPKEDSTPPARPRDLRLTRSATVNLAGSFSRLILGKANARHLTRGSRNLRYLFAAIGLEMDNGNYP